ADILSVDGLLPGDERDVTLAGDDPLAPVPGRSVAGDVIAIIAELHMPLGDGDAIALLSVDDVGVFQDDTVTFVGGRPDSPCLSGRQGVRAGAYLVDQEGITRTWCRTGRRGEGRDGRAGLGRCRWRQGRRLAGPCLLGQRGPRGDGGQRKREPGPHSWI